MSVIRRLHIPQRTTTDESTTIDEYTTTDEYTTKSQLTRQQLPEKIDLVKAEIKVYPKKTNSKNVTAWKVLL